MEDQKISRLGNGIRLIHKKVNNTKIMHCGFILDIGSRDEPENLQGIAHFWEHMAFKGTRTRNSFRIINFLESVGGELNAFTTKEKICFHASVLYEHFERAVELLTDITFFSTFPLKEIEKEKKVILDEMLMYEDLPEESIQDDLDAALFPGHPIGRNILGNRRSVKHIKHHHFLEFIRKNLNSNKIVVSVIGNLEYDYCRKVIEGRLDKLPGLTGNNVRSKPRAASVVSRITGKNIAMAYCAIGFPAYSVKNRKRLKLFMLSNLLGGPSMNSRLNMELRERRGLVYSVDASYVPFCDTGEVGIYFGTQNGGLARSIDLVYKEIKKIREVPLGRVQLHQAKEQLVGQLAMAEENNVSLMIMLGRSLLDLNRIELLEEVIREIRSVKPRELTDIANEIFTDNKMCLLTYEPD